MTPDAINACFEAGGAVLLCLNVRRLLRDKSVKGVSLWPVAWWNVWGVWNVIYYQALVQPLSFWGGVAVVVLNTVWLALALGYAREARTGKKPRNNPPNVRLIRRVPCRHVACRFDHCPVCCECGASL